MLITLEVQVRRVDGPGERSKEDIIEALSDATDGMEILVLGSTYAVLGMQLPLEDDPVGNSIALFLKHLKKTQHR
jgi:hypothetical protein